MFSNEDPWRLIIKKKNNGIWGYDIPGQFHPKLKELVGYITVKASF